MTGERAHRAPEAGLITSSSIVLTSPSLSLRVSGYLISSERQTADEPLTPAAPGSSQRRRRLQRSGARGDDDIPHPFSIGAVRRTRRRPPARSRRLARGRAPAGRELRHGQRVRAAGPVSVEPSGAMASPSTAP